MGRISAGKRSGRQCRGDAFFLKGFDSLGLIESSVESSGVKKGSKLDRSVGESQRFFLANRLAALFSDMKDPPILYSALIALVKRALEGTDCYIGPSSD